MITSIRNKKRQQAMVIFPAPFSIFTSEDIAANGGIEFSELLNSEENLCMGRAVQSNVSIALINSNKLLSSMDFMQEFTVLLGVETADGTTAVRSGATLAVKVGNDVITASPSWTQVYINSTSHSISGTTAALFVYGNQLYVIGNTGAVIGAFIINGSTMTATSLPSWNAHMLGKAKRWAANGTCLSYVGNTMHECSVSGNVMAYKTSHFAPLGYFMGSKPDKVKTQIVSLSGNDLMQKFEVNAAGYFDTLTYPTTLGVMFNALCAYCGVAVGDVSAALNMNKSFSAAPINNDTSTCREVLAYIAEAAGCYARIGRDGKCELVWFSSMDYMLNRTDYFSIDMAEYTVQKIDKLQSHVTQDDIGVIVGTGTNGYDIVDNPYLNGATDSEMRPWVTNIYNRLAAFAEYSPITVNCESYWALRCGDIITVETEEGNKQLPIFAQTISWAGNARASLQSTGDQTRGVMTAVNREKLVNGRNFAEISKTVEGVSVKVGKAETAASNAESAAKTNADNITALTSRVEDAELKITPDAIVATVRSNTIYQGDLADVKKDAISGADKNTDEKLRNYSTTEEMNAVIETTASGITSTVYSKTQVDNLLSAEDKTYVQFWQPSGTFNVGDVWVKTQASQAWNTLKGMTWETVKSKAWGEWGYTDQPQTYVWNGAEWVLTVDYNVVQENQTTITQTKKEISLKADQTTVDAISGRVTENSTEIRQTAEDITLLAETSEGLKSQITQNAETIRTLVTNGEGMQSQIDQQAGQIALKANRDEPASGVATSTVTVNAEGVNIKTGGTFTVDSGNFDVDASGTLKAYGATLENANVFGTILSGGSPVLTSNDIHIGTDAPGNPHVGMAWIKPDTSTSAQTSFSAPVPWRLHENMASSQNNYRTGVLSGTAVASVGTTYTYKAQVPVYIGSYSAQPTGAYVHFEILSGANGSVLLHAEKEVTITEYGSGDKIIEFNFLGSSWVGNNANLHFRIYTTPLANHREYNVMTSSNSSLNISLVCISSSSAGAQGWRQCEVYYYA